METKDKVEKFENEYFSSCKIQLFANFVQLRGGVWARLELPAAPRPCLPKAVAERPVVGGIDLCRASGQPARTASALGGAKTTAAAVHAATACEGIVILSKEIPGSTIKYEKVILSGFNPYTHGHTAENNSTKLAPCGGRAALAGEFCLHPRPTLMSAAHMTELRADHCCALAAALTVH